MPIPISIRVRLIEQALYHVRRGTGLNRSGPHAVGCRNCQHLPGRRFGRELAPSGDEQLFPQRETAALTRAIFHILLGSSREQTGEAAVGTLLSDIPDAPQRSMMTVPELAADALGSFLAWDMKTRFGSSLTRLTELVPSMARLALECIGNSDALYHNVEHTMLVTLAGRDILRGRALLAPTKATDYAHLIVACLLHDIGYVRGILKDDHAEGYVVDAAGGRVKLPRGASDAALLTHHVDRSILFVLDRDRKSTRLNSSH